MRSEFRVENFNDFIGQSKLKETLKVMISSSQKLHQPIDHILFYGPPGLGKTTLAKIISNETKRNITYVQGPLIERKSDLLTMLSSIKENDIVFIDEIHGINKNIEELLYSALEDGVVDVVIGVDGDKRIMRMRLNKFSLIGATTKFNLVSKPLKDRFGYIGKLKNYTDKEIEKIIFNSAIRNNIKIDDASIAEIARHSRQTPRIANNLLKRVYDFTLYENKPQITLQLVKKAFEHIGIYEFGLYSTQIDYLKTLHEVFNDSYASIETIGSIVRDDRNTIINEIEPLLLYYKFIEKSPRGRRITQRGIDYLLNFM
ncbi:Holliday junction branch migration DNA helicase RuvB [Metamycoplasma hyosynoviae]|uniref:Holliday junction branch migration DNA helicase RuvB n=3 Tax=Metamycoplasma hyosynoviae TaxID=29559 RepID=UPI002358965E|nr:Holliday junction branch migration DNA helicase RuvB [Metamycoplasma hyosynoviae]MDC8918128.1 Holliday junction branch migration DNA helicase RuvB [Metamycoplasma hyosynoviae]MDC8938170.1 Holliday junction branch migration DNA helicase RuvB [Metamycoplasma hyosynoviae]MDC8963245.1 Holliday junction branch migration DNA helicase RuvB [Metamycoplasma hyosynoviae]MDD1360284.1 Holliday junction branch migration DNA helicase RuvB [Metamycoplasma hyosynoviae]MDD1360689.1 Holliday junction branch 